MALSSIVPPIPVDTNHAAKAVYSRDNFFLVIGDRLADLLAGVDLDGIHAANLIARREKPSLAMVTILQFVETLSDPQAVEATRTRLDWKYALHLSMNYPGFHTDALCAYRQWVLHEPARLQGLQIVLDRLIDAGLLVGDQGQRVAANTVLDEVCSVTRFERIFQAMESALGTLAILKSEWLQNISLPHWYTRYLVFNASRPLPSGRGERTAFTEAVGADMYYLLECFARDAQTEWARTQEVTALHEVWREQFEQLHTCDTKLMERCSFCEPMLEQEVPSNDLPDNSHPC